MTPISARDTRHPHQFDKIVPVYSGEKFKWRGRTGTAEISELVRGVANCPLYKSAFNDYPEVQGLKVVSPTTGKVMEFVLIQVDRIGHWEDCEISGWRLRSKCGIELLVIND